MHLLAAGRTVDGAKDGPNRYKMTEKGYLPKFAKANRSISLAPSAEPAVEPSKKVIQPSLFDAVQAAREQGILPAETKPVVVSTAQRAPLSIQPQPSWFARLVGRFKTFSARRTRRVCSAKPLQGEWSLDKVTVVRNDLSETEVVVASKEATSARSAEAAETKSTGPAGLKDRWGKVVSRFSKTSDNIFK